MNGGTLRETAEHQLLRYAPTIFDQLTGRSAPREMPQVIVLCHTHRSSPKYRFRRLDGRPWRPAKNSTLSAHELMRPFSETYRRAGEGTVPQDVFMAFDLELGQVWYHRLFQALGQIPPHQRFSIDSLRSTLRPLRLPGTTPHAPRTPPSQRRSTPPPIARTRAPKEEPPVLNTKAELIEASGLGTARETLGPPSDRPEEVFLLGEDLLRLAVDSLGDTEVLDPLPVHLNALWVFSRPIELLRPDGRRRHIRAVWFRQGTVVWRMRAYAKSVKQKPEVGFQLNGGELAGRIPFVPRWEDRYPEQKLLAAVWALIQQGDITETHDAPPREPGILQAPAPFADGVHVVQLKGGSEHERMYQGQGQSLIAREAWSVRGHWRRQPYPSLGLDEHGKPLTKLIWIASYVKGDPDGLPPAPKIIEVR